MLPSPTPVGLTNGSAPARATHARPSVLVVEDEALVAKDIERTLVELGYRVVAVVRSGNAALQAIERSRPNLVLSDIGLKGGLDGIELASMIRERFGTPVVFLTSYSDEATLRRIGGVGPYGYLTKPFRAAELRVSLDLALRRRELDDTLHQLALTDELTGLYNRRGFLALAEQQLKVANRASQRVMLVFADLNGMKAVNDACGHEAGDRLLIDAASALRRTFRNSDIVARLGGDEFAALLVDPDSSAQHVVERRILDSVRQRNRESDACCTLSISVGVCVSEPNVRRSLADLMAAADANMYLAKTAQRSIVPPLTK